MKAKVNEFFVINITNKNIVLGDLYTTVPARATVNFLSKHYNFTLDQLIDSATKGSLFRKRSMLWLRNGELIKDKEVIKLEDAIMPSRTNSKSVLEPEVYDELLDISDDEYLEDHFE